MDDIRSRLETALEGGHSIERELGGGGMSRTYLAVETALQRRVVIKVLAPELLAGISVERFRREVLLAAKLQHPHVVPVLTAGEIDDLPWFTMPYVDGDSLRQRLEHGALPIGEAVSILRDVARALAYAHGQGIVHRDIKPDNVLLSAGSATVTDFGIAKAISAARTDAGQHGATLTQVGTSIGTPAYMAPEQAAGDPDTDHRADLYAFGVMAYEIIAGRTPFVASTPTKLLAAHLSEEPVSVLELRPDCPAPLAALVMTCLAKDPAERPQTAAEIVRVLDTITSSGGVVTVPAILKGGRIRLGRALAIWAVATALVSLTAWAARDAIGLPDWVLPGSFGVMLAGLPVLLVTAWVQRVTHRVLTATPQRTPAAQGTMATLAIKASPHLSWRRAWLGGAVAVGGFALLVVAFMVMRAMGIGPMASLQAKGTFGSDEALMIADFRSPPSDSTLGVTLAEALRADLAQSSSLDILTRSEIREAMLLMQRPVEESVLYDVAREIATREGAKAVLDGGISQVGKRYVITARLVSTLEGTDLAVFRQEAADENDILPALGRLAREVRSRAGESLRTIRASSELERVTTPSLIALRKYVEGSRLADEKGESERGIALLREAVAIDTAFAMAWRKLAVLISNTGRDYDGMLDAISTAYRHRDRLTEMERLLTEGFYYSRGPERDLSKALAAYEAAANLDSLSTAALNNAASIFSEMHQYEKAEQYYRKVVRLPRAFGGGFVNLLLSQIRNRRSAAALDSTVELYRATLPESIDFWEAEWHAAWGKGDPKTADSIAAAIAADPRSLRQGLGSTFKLATLAEYRGQISETRRWLARYRETLEDAEPGVANQINAALDSAYLEAMYGDPEAAAAMVRRALDRTPIREIPASRRPWSYLNSLGAVMGDADLARQGLEGWERDQASIDGDPVARRAEYASMVAYAERRWDDVISSITAAERGFAIPIRTAQVYRGIAYMESGRPDSAIVSFEKFLQGLDPDGLTDAIFRADVLRRMGELHEARGDRARAIDYYLQLTTQWADADPELQPKVREIRERIARLRGETG